MIRALRLEDFSKLQEIHRKHFANEFNFPDFLNYICVFVVEDENGIITAGGIRSIAEVVTVTNKDRTPKDRIDALYEIFNASIYAARRTGYDQLYAWSQNPQWANRLRRNGFRPPVGESLIFDL